MQQKPIRPFLRMASAGGVFLLSFTLLTAFAEAQTKHPVQVAEIECVSTELQLTAVQQAAVTRIVEDFRDAVEATTEMYGFDLEEGRPPLRFSISIRSDMQKNVAQMEQQLAAVLTPAQLQKLKTMQRQMGGALLGS